MGYIKIDQSKITKDIAQKLIELCPFNAFDYEEAYLSINAACKMCKLCVKKGIEGVCTFIETPQPSIDKKQYHGIGVYIEHHEGIAHPVGFELIGKAKILASKTLEKVYAIIIGSDVINIAKEALSYGVDTVYIYQDERYKSFDIETYTEAMAHFCKEHHLNILLIGGTPQGRSFAPRIAARLHTGLTADCTELQISDEGDLMQIRPAFGGNIMAKIFTPRHRPQLATIRYKMFSAPKKTPPKGTIIHLSTDSFHVLKRINQIARLTRLEAEDISDAEVIIAVGRAFKKVKDLELVEPLRKRLNASLACTRPLIENGWFDARKQIGLSGRTVKPKLLINIGISGAVQFIEGMKEAELIISINADPDNRLFDLSHYAIIGDLYEILPEFNRLLGNESG